MAALLTLSGCSLPDPERVDTVSLVGTVIRFAIDSLKVGPRVILARTTISTPVGPVSSAVHAAVVASMPGLSGVEQSISARQTCETIVGIPVCSFEAADGLMAVTKLSAARDSADATIEYQYTMELFPFGTKDPGMKATMRGKKLMVLGAGNVHLTRDKMRSWRVVRFGATKIGVSQ